MMRELVPWGLFDFKPTELSGSHTGDDKTECFGCPLYSAELVRGPRPGFALESSTMAIRRDARFC